MVDSLGWKVYCRLISQQVKDREKALASRVGPDELVEHNYLVGVKDGLNLAISSLEVWLASEERKGDSHG
jgi:hypothetical protein